MAGPMPMPEGQEAPPAEEGGGEGGEFMKLVSNIMKGMSMLGEGLEASGKAPPEVLQGLSDVMSQFEAVIGGLQGGGQAPKGGASQLQEAQGRPVSPAGV